MIRIINSFKTKDGETKYRYTYYDFTGNNSSEINVDYCSINEWESIIIYQELYDVIKIIDYPRFRNKDIIKFENKRRSR